MTKSQLLAAQLPRQLDRIAPDTCGQGLALILGDGMTGESFGDPQRRQNLATGHATGPLLMLL